jgi:conjugative transfer signal peptidase TraF
MLCWRAGLRVNLTPSLPYGIYVLCPGTPGRGDLAAFCLEGKFADLARERGYLQAGSCPSGLRPLLKTLTGLPGDAIPADLAVRPTDSLGRSMPSASASGIIPPGMALLLTDHPGSFDSRYFGLAPLDALQRVKPVFLFNLQGELP